MRPTELGRAELCQLCDPTQFAFETTAEVEGSPDIVGQDRAIDAIRFGIAMRHEGYNLFAFGPVGVGRHVVVRRFLERHAASEPVPDDWCYVNNFDVSRTPKALRLPPGRGVALQRDVEQLITDLKAALESAMDSDAFRDRLGELEKGSQGTHDAELQALVASAREQGVALMRTQTGFAFAPLQDGEVITPEAYEALPEDEHEAIDAKIAGLQEKLGAIMRRLPRLQRDVRGRVRELKKETAATAIGPLIEDLCTRYADLDDVVTFLRAIESDVLKSGPGPQEVDESSTSDSESRWTRYRVNVVVDRSGDTGAPVVYADHPTLTEVMGRVETVVSMGVLYTDVSLIRAGALHRANGGYLILDARRVLLQPSVWDRLKQSLRSREIRFGLGESASLMNAVTLDPEPIPLRVQVVLIGEPELYYQISEADPEFSQLFKVPVDFASSMSRTPETVSALVSLLAHLIDTFELRPFHRDAVAQVVAIAARLAGDASKVSIHMQTLVDLLRNADHYGSLDNSTVIRAEHVRQAVSADRYRRGRLRERVVETITEGVVHIETEGQVSGQVNGLSVTLAGGLAFGRPLRITARVWAGRGRVIDIEREVKLGGPLHSKGVLILSGFLGSRYGRLQPLALSASLVFEQSYGAVDGDSATLAETIALLSAIAEIGVRQDIAVTGSLDQRGVVQAIGGVNEKIEGFFDICRSRGLTGEQGVLIPASNTRHLMLRDDVLEAVGAGDFHVWTVDNVDEALALLTGLDAGEMTSDGQYAAGSVNRRVTDRLAKLAQQVRQWAAPEKT